LLGASGVRLATDLRHALTALGKQWAIEAFSKNQYVGPAPVTLETYCSRIMRQAISNARIDRAAIDRAFSGLAISPNFVLQIGPAINSGKSILLYGPAGNGKTTVAERIGTAFPDVIYIPYAFQVEGQIVKVFDAAYTTRCCRQARASRVPRCAARISTRAGSRAGGLSSWSAAR
jgi:hypothetical protein